MADERGHVLQQVESGVSEQEIRERFVQQGFMVYSVKTRRGLLPVGGGSRKKILKADQFVIFNQQFLTLIRAGLPILGGYRWLRNTNHVAGDDMRTPIGTLELRLDR